MISPNASFQNIRLDLIEVDEVRARFLNPARVMRLADNIEDVGLLNPITVRPSKDREGYLLVCGGHRVAACQELGWETIPAFVRELTDEQARQVEVQENLIREDLTVLDRALHLVTEKAIYEARNPVSKQGGDRKSDQMCNVAHLISQRFTLEMAEALDCSEDAVKRAVRIAKGITPELHEEITGTPLADNQAQLLKLVDLPPEDRAPIVRTMKAHGVYKVEKGRQLLAGVEEQPPLPLEEAWQRKMTALWASGKKGWQHRLVESGTSLSQLDLSVAVGQADSGVLYVANRFNSAEAPISFGHGVTKVAELASGIGTTQTSTAVGWAQVREPGTYGATASWAEAGAATAAGRAIEMLSSAP